MRVHGNIFAVILWAIWCARNRWVFENKRIEPRATGFLIAALTEDITRAYGMDTQLTTMQRPPREVRWLGVPNDYMVALNVDGSAMGDPLSAGFGGPVERL